VGHVGPIRNTTADIEYPSGDGPQRHGAPVTLGADLFGTLDTEPAWSSPIAPVCRRGGCRVLAATDGLCPDHQAVQDRLRELADQRPSHQRINLPVLPTSRPTWHEDAACRGQGADTFYPEPPRGGRRQGDPYAEARAICATCPVVEQCRQAGQREYYGVWGGLSPSQRRPRHQVA
jgi:WhiB family redox-sensing transcriptional regulator